MPYHAPRRCDMLRWVPAEKAIYDAAQVVEGMPADTRLTMAVTRLGEAREFVADYVDGAKPIIDEKQAADMALNDAIRKYTQRMRPFLERRWRFVPELLWQSWGLGVDMVWCKTCKMAGVRIGPLSFSFGWSETCTLKEVRE